MIPLQTIGAVVLVDTLKLFFNENFAGWCITVATSSLGAFFLSRCYQRWENRIRLLKMEVVDFGDIHAGPAVYIVTQTRYECLRQTTYRIKNDTDKDFRELVIHIGFREGEIVRVVPTSEMIGGSHFSIRNDQRGQFSITIPIFNRGNIVDLRVEIANCSMIDPLWKYVGSQSGVEIIFEPIQGIRNREGSVSLSGNVPGQFQAERVGIIKRIRYWFADKVRGD